MADTDEAFMHCREQWVRTFNQGPHTSFPMFQFVMSALGLEAKDIFRDPNRLADFRARRVSDEQLDALLRDYTWGNRPGRCTTFAICVAHRLQELYPEDGFQFEFFDLGKHRVARCNRYGFLIDSESKWGIEMLPDDEDWSSTPNHERGRWRYSINHSIFEDWTEPSRGVRDVQPIRAAAAFGICLEQVARHAVLVCVFRSMPDQGPCPTIDHQTARAQYHGAVRWRLAERRIELLPNVNRKDQFATITFGEGDEETNRICARKLVAFIRACGIEEQWRAGNCDIFNRQLWRAAIKECGYPVYEET